ncbi:hypothetical protein [Thioalkalivibrio sp. ALE28]|uniref:hypothetical protein n=1 Tax=Thioalkalivibrio sp. ALE28 TaxID=1158179 RepID=UPI000379A047|nr:hypothetical protein [Thioalkalivibrio sp. ALE28]
MGMQLAEEMMADGRPYAALAELDSLGQEAAEVKLARAQILGRIGHDEARDEFEALRDHACFRGVAHHGLALLDVRAGRYGEAAETLRIAREELPNVARVRNDYGFVLLIQGQEEAAEFELRTALELSNGDERALENLLLVLMKRDDTEGMDQLMRQYKVGEDLIVRLDQRFRALDELRNLEASGDMEGLLQQSPQEGELGMPDGPSFE